MTQQAAAEQIDQAVYNMKRLKLIGGFEPIWSKNSSFAPVQLEFESYFQNFERERC